MTCERCGLESEIKDSFRTVPRSFRVRPITLCPVCLQRRQRAPYSLSLAMFAFVGLFGVVFLVAMPGPRSPGWVPVNTCLFGLMTLAVVIPHEFAHALVAWALGSRVFQVVFGLGRVVFERRWLGVVMQWRSVPAGGVTIVLSRYPRWYRLRYLCVILAGPLANFLLAGAVWPWVGKDLARWDSSWAVAAPFFAANLLAAITNLLPFRVPTAFGTAYSDGWQLWLTPFLSRKVITELATTRYCYCEATDARRRHDHLAARRWCERGLENAPHDQALLNGLALSWLELGDIDRARETFHRLLACEGLTPIQTALFRNNVAYADAIAALGGRAELLPEADELSAAALAAAPWVPAFKGTRGAVLVARGLHDEGIALLREAMAAHTEATGKADNAYLIALAADRTDRPRERDRHLSLARKLNPNSQLQALFPFVALQE